MGKQKKDEQEKPMKAKSLSYLRDVPWREGIGISCPMCKGTNVRVYSTNMPIRYMICKTCEEADQRAEGKGKTPAAYTRNLGRFKAVDYELDAQIEARRQELYIKDLRTDITALTQIVERQHNRAEDAHQELMNSARLLKERKEQLTAALKGGGE